jgi:hypothetical protein
MTTSKIPPPVVHGMPAVETTYEVHWTDSRGRRQEGRIRLGDGCKDDYQRLVANHRNGRVLILQSAAMDSFLDAERELGSELGVTGSHRSCAQQTLLNHQDPTRFAAPDGSYHPRGLAIDVSQAQSAKKLRDIHRILSHRRWYRPRTDEPWHYSFGGEG